jgi:hypothetical protein
MMMFVARVRRRGEIIHSQYMCIYLANMG